MKESGLIDFDGTLLNSSYRHKKLLYDLLKPNLKLLRRTDLNDYLQYKKNGKSTLSYLIYKFPNLNCSQINKDWIYKIENQEYLRYDTLFKDSIYFLDEITKYYTLILVTARNNRSALLMQITTFRLKDYFKEIIIIKPGEPKYAEVKNCVSDIYFVIGDTEVDYELAYKIGCDFCALNRGFRSKEFWNYKNVKSYNSLEKILDKIMVSRDKFSRLA